MPQLFWTYYVPDEVARAAEHIDVLVKRGVTPDEAARSAARIYRQRTGDFGTPFVRGHLAAQWRIRYRASTGASTGVGFGLPTGPPRHGGRFRPSKYPTEVSFRATFHRLFYE